MMINNNILKQLALGTAIALSTTLSFAAPSVKLTLGGTDASAAKTFGDKVLSSGTFFTPCHTESSALTLALATEATKLTAYENAKLATVAGEKVVTDLTTLYTSSNTSALATPGAVITAGKTLELSTIGATFTLELDGTPITDGTTTWQQFTAAIAGYISDSQLALDAAVTGLVALEADAKTTYDAAVAATALIAAGPLINGGHVDEYKDQLKIGIEAKGNELNVAGSEYKYDLYFMMVNLSAPGSNDGAVANGLTAAVDLPEAQMYMFTRETSNANDITLNNPLTVQLLLDAPAANAKLAADRLAAIPVNSVGLAYVKKEFWTSADYTNDNIESGLNLEANNLPQGTWMAVAIMADEATLSFSDPRTWLAWDASVIIMGSPFRTGAFNAGNVDADGTLVAGEYFACE